MSKFKVWIDKGCIACQNCERVCPEVFEVKETSRVKTPDLDDLKCALDAAEQCPVNVIHIKETKTNKKVI